MKLGLLAFSLLSCSSFLTLEHILTKPASAQCVQADISIQYNISGSRQPTERTNDVEFEKKGTCTGNANVTTNVQGNVGGTGRVTQTRQVRNRIQGDSDNRTGVNGPTVQIKTNPQIDVYNPVDRFRY